MNRSCFLFSNSLAASPHNFGRKIIMIAPLLPPLDQDQNDVLRAMLDQEQHSYRLRADDHNYDIKEQLEPVDVECRRNMVDWCYRMINYCQLQRETVSIAMNYVDRFFLSRKSSVEQSFVNDHSSYQLIVMTSLFVAIKVHEARVIDIQTLSLISNGLYNKKQIEGTELQILKKLKWRLHPPTAMSFVRNLLDNNQKENKLSLSMTKTLLSLITIQTERATYDPDLCAVRASIIGYSALVNAFQKMCIYSSDIRALRLASAILRAKILVITDISDKKLSYVQSKLSELLDSYYKPCPNKCVPWSLIQANETNVKIYNENDVTCTDDNILTRKKESPRSAMCTT